MNVDPDELRALASTMDQIGAEIDALSVRRKTDGVVSSMPGSSLGAACAVGGEFTEGAWLRLAMRCARISSICKGAAGTYEVADQEFRDRIAEMGGGL